MTLEWRQTRPPTAITSHQLHTPDNKSFFYGQKVSAIFTSGIICLMKVNISQLVVFLFSKRNTRRPPDRQSSHLYFN